MISNASSSGATTEARGIHGYDDLQTLTLEEVGRLYGISRRSLSNYVKEGRLRAVQVGRKKRVTVSALKAFLEGRYVKAVPAGV